MVDKYESWMDGTCVKLDEYDNIVAFVPGKSFDFKEKEEYYKTVNIYKFSKHFHRIYMFLSLRHIVVHWEKMNIMNRFLEL